MDSASLVDYLKMSENDISFAFALSGIIVAIFFVYVMFSMTD